MDEERWLAAVRPGPMLAHLQGAASARKLRLFACACCRRHWNLFTDERSRRAVEAVERFADGAASAEEMRAAVRAGHAAGLRARSARLTAEAEQRAGRGLPGWWEREQAVRAAAEREGAAWLAWQLADLDRESVEAAAEFGAEAAAERDAEPEERRAQAALVREVFGNPFRRTLLDPGWLAWNDGAVPRLARVIDAEGAFDRLPLLADALEEAGCDAAAILHHCRGAGAHARGCWAVDLLLGRV